MIILQINTVYKNGGSTGRIVYDLQRIQEQYGIDSYVAYGYNTNQVDTPQTICLQTPLRRKWNILKTRLFARHGFYNVAETKRLINYMDAVKPDVIHLHNIHNHYVNVEMLFDYIKKNEIPVVWTLHDCWPFTGWCAYFDYAQCGKWETGCHHCPSKHDYPFTWFFDRSESNYEKKKEIFCGVKNLTLVTPSQWLANLTRQSFLREYPVEVINNGTDTKIFRPMNTDLKSRLGITDKKMILAIAAKLAKRKGADYLLQIPTKLNDDEVLVMLGLTDGQVESLPKEKCLGVTYTNSIQELAEYYSAADIFINPTLEDNFPTTNIESLACGTPIVTFKTGGSIEAVLDEESIEYVGKVMTTSVGAVVPQNDIESMVQATREVINMGKSMFCDACRRKVEERYDKDKQYLQYIKLYKEIQKNES